MYALYSFNNNLKLEKDVKNCNEKLVLKEYKKYIKNNDDFIFLIFKLDSDGRKILLSPTNTIKLSFIDEQVTNFIETLQNIIESTRDTTSLNVSIIEIIEDILNGVFNINDIFEMLYDLSKYHSQYLLTSRSRTHPLLSTYSLSKSDDDWLMYRFMEFEKDKKNLLILLHTKRYPIFVFQNIFWKIKKEMMDEMLSIF